MRKKLAPRLILTEKQGIIEDEEVFPEF